MLPNSSQVPQKEVLNKLINQTISDIKSLKIQGATFVALSIISLIEEIAKFQKKKNVSDFEFIRNTGNQVTLVRLTEPLAQNSVKFIFRNSPDLDGIIKNCVQTRKLIKKSSNKVVENASSLIKNNGIYFTHCHSSSVVSAFKKAKDAGKKFTIHVSETRPLFQGRKTARELKAAGIEDVNFMVDSTLFSQVAEGKLKIDAVFIGADMLAEKGFANKVGSLALAYLSDIRKIPLFLLSILLKYDFRENAQNYIEKRDKDEIWSDSPKRLTILNPAFDFVPYFKNIRLITEVGIVSPDKLKETVLKNYLFVSKIT